MAIQQINIPDVGDFDSVEVIEVLVSVGDTVAIDDSLMTLESDKATMEIPSPVAGKVTKVTVAIGDKVKQGTYVLDIEVSGEAAAPAPKNEEAPKAAAPVVKAAAPAPAARTVTAPTLPVTNAAKPVNNQSMGAASHASPAVRAFARNLGVDLTQVSGKGPKGRIQKTDVEALIKAVMQGQASAPGTASNSGSGIPALPVIDFSQFGPIETVELGRIKKISGKHLHTSWLNVPHVTQFDECDISELEKFRQDMKATAEKQGVKLTPLVFVMKAVVKALQEFPNFNASLSPDAQSLIKKGYYNIGVAVDTPNGLMVPVVKNVDQKGIYELSRDLMEISKRARDGKLTPSDISGGCFSISSLGGIGGTQFTPIVNAPEVAIMGLSKAKMQPVWNGKEFAPRLIMPFSLSYDHRAIDGAEGVRFTTTVGQYLTDLRQLLM